jgi:hypothetical protein
MTILPKATYSFNITPTKIPTEFSSEAEKDIASHVHIWNLTILREEQQSKWCNQKKGRRLESLRPAWVT